MFLGKNTFFDVKHFYGLHSVVFPIRKLGWQYNVTRTVLYSYLDNIRFLLLHLLLLIFIGIIAYTLIQKSFSISITLTTLLSGQGLFCILWWLPNFKFPVCFTEIIIDIFKIKKIGCWTSPCMRLFRYGVKCIVFKYSINVSIKYLIIFCFFKSFVDLLSMISDNITYKYSQVLVFLWA